MTGVQTCALPIYDKLREIVQLVGEDVLPNDQRLVLEVANVIKKGFLQQNALHPEDTYVQLPKQYKMLQVIDTLYNEALACVKMDIPIGVIRKQEAFEEIVKMKYTVSNDEIEKLDELREKITRDFNTLKEQYQ